MLEPDPCLNGKYNIPMSVPALSEVAQALHSLSADVPEVLCLPKHSGSKGYGKRLIAIVPSVDKQRLYNNAKQWMDDVIDCAITDDTPTCDIVHVLIRVLRAMEPLAFDDIISTSADDEISRSRYELDPELQQAMIYKANLGVSQVRVIKSYLCYSNLDILQPETVMKELQVNEFVRPIPIEFREGKGNRKRVAWHVPADDLLTWNTNQKLEANAFDYKNLDKAHIIMVGDHGQGAFRMMISLLLIARQSRRRGDWRRRGAVTVNPYIGTALSLEVDGMIGYVQCAKDTYEILAETISIPINEALLRIQQKGRVTIYQDRLDHDMIKFCFGNTHTQNTVLGTATIEQFIVGDLAFYSMALGKEAMAPHWCWRCHLSKKEWTDDINVRVGTEWTLEGLNDHLALLEDGTLNKKKAEDVRGVKTKALFCISVQNMLVPSLHNVELFVNTPICNGLMQWVHHRIEQLPLPVIEARLAEVDLIIEIEKVNSDLRDSREALSYLVAEATALKPTKRRGTLEFRDADHERDYTENQGLLRSAKDRVAELTSLCRSLQEEKKIAVRKINAILKLKEHGALSQEIRQGIEQMLEEMYRIIRSAYRGGDFEGNHCRKWMRQADSVMDSIETLLLSVPQANRATGCDDSEIHRYCRSYKRLFQYFDALINYCQQPFGTLTDTNMTEVRKLVNLLDRLWRRLLSTVPPKAHAWHHLLDDLERLRGLKHHSESKIEVSHQIGRRVDLLFRSVNDISKKIECSMKHQHTMEKSSMRMIQAKVKDDRSHKRTVDALNEQQEDRHGAILLLLDLPEIVEDFPSLTSLAVADRKKEAEDDVNVVNNLADAADQQET